MNEINRHKKYYLVLDTETTFLKGKTLVYDIGFAVTDGQGNLYYKRHYAVYEVFVLRPDLMRTAYYGDKVPLYWNRITHDRTKIHKFFDIRAEILDIMELYRIKEVGAANCAFDKKALSNTLEFLWGDEQNYFPSETKFFCIWHMACQALCTKTSYLRFCLENGFESEKGNVSTSAETVFRYLINKPEYCEEHMGLADVEIETAIFAACLKTHKKIDRGINSKCWKIPQERYHKMKGGA